MSNKLKITITGGSAGESEEVRDLFTSLLVGRSRSADIRIKEADVSGRHFEFVRSTSGCSVKVLSQNGMVVDGKAVGEGMIEPVCVGVVLQVGEKVKIRIDEMPESNGSIAEGMPTEAGATPGGADFFEGESDLGTVTALPDDEPANEDEGVDSETRGDFEDALTEAGDGETQEMKTRVGSMEEIYRRKRQLDRASVVRRWKFFMVIVIVMMALGAVWFATGSRRHVSDAEGPFLPNGEPDVVEIDLCGESGEVELAFEYPRDDRMKVVISKDSNTVEVVSYLGIDRDVPFHLEFRRWKDSADMQYSLEDSFERLMLAEADPQNGKGVTFETRAGERPEGEFYEDVFPGYCETKTLQGVRIVRTEFTRTMRHELWHGVYIYFRHGDTIYLLRREIPEMYWKRGGYRITGEPNMLMFASFSRNHWDSPGASGLVAGEISDDELMVRIKKELAAERISAWPTLERYINTLLVRSWSEKPTVAKAAMDNYLSFLERKERFYNERRLAYRTAKANRDEKRMHMIINDCKTVFGPMWHDRRSMLVNNPEVWGWR